MHLHHLLSKLELKDGLPYCSIITTKMNVAENAKFNEPETQNLATRTGK